MTRKTSDVRSAPLSKDNRSATDRTIDGIVSMIGSGELKPTTRLPPESELGTLMGVSRGSLREAVRVLTHLGILDVRVGDGTYVTDLSGANLLRGFALLGRVANEKTVLEIFEIRRVLESAAAAMAASRITSDALAELEEHLKALRSETDNDNFVKMDIRFHDLIAAATGNVSLRMLCGSFSAQTHRARLMRGHDVEGILARSTMEHDDIFRHIKEREPVLAAAAVTSHIASVERWLREEYAEVANEEVPTPPRGGGE
ncbi:MAG: FCD domain-containing protein [bacterium]|nr:FCD domain-containing protein [Acidimicrobiia bacterium]MCY4649288.1 FCD domain-containing protein [bacterium]